jgi:hypothetical protein
MPLIEKPRSWCISIMKYEYMLVHKISRQRARNVTIFWNCRLLLTLFPLYFTKKRSVNRKFTDILCFRGIFISCAYESKTRLPAVRIWRLRWWERPISIAVYHTVTGMGVATQNYRSTSFHRDRSSVRRGYMPYEEILGHHLQYVYFLNYSCQLIITVCDFLYRHIC